MNKCSYSYSSNRKINIPTKMLIHYEPVRYQIFCVPFMAERDVLNFPKDSFNKELGCKINPFFEYAFATF